jgi:hypothetical protein
MFIILKIFRFKLLLIIFINHIIKKKIVDKNIPKMKVILVSYKLEKLFSKKISFNGKKELIFFVL